MQQTNSSQLLYDNIVKFLTKKGTKNEKNKNKKTTTLRHNVKDDLNNIVGWTEKHNASACIRACL